MSYSAEPDELNRQASRYVSRLLTGAKPAYLPVEQPTQFELVLNRATARALGIEIPGSLLVLATSVVE